MTCDDFIAGRQVPATNGEPLTGTQILDTHDDFYLKIL